MADINSGNSGSVHARDAYRGASHDAPPSPSAATGALIDVVEFLFFAYRDFTGEADAVLTDFDFGRAHHRVLHFVSRRPGLRVADLLDILRITKQSLARVLKELVDRGYVTQEAGATDRRERRLFLTPQGEALAERLARLQIEQIGRALTAAGPDSEAAVRSFLTGLVGTAAPAPPSTTADSRNPPRSAKLGAGERSRTRGNAP